jgi:hypothetical protein
LPQSRADGPFELTAGFVAWIGPISAACAMFFESSLTGAVHDGERLTIAGSFCNVQRPRFLEVTQKFERHCRVLTAIYELIDYGALALQASPARSCLSVGHEQFAK